MGENLPRHVDVRILAATASPQWITSPPPTERTTPPDKTLAQVEREHILAVLEASGDTKAEAARRLGIGTATLFRGSSSGIGFRLAPWPSG